MPRNITKPCTVGLRPAKHQVTLREITFLFKHVNLTKGAC